MTQPFLLYRLQQIDSQIDRALARSKDIEFALSQDEAVRQAQAAAGQAEAALAAQRKALKLAEQEVQNQAIKIEQTEAALYGGKVRNPKELQDLQKDVAALKRYRSVLEDRQLEVMLACEEAESLQVSSTAALQAALSASAGQHAALHEEQGGIQRDLGRLAGERSAAATGIDAAALALYEQIRKARRGTAVSKVDGRACSACGTVLNAALLAQAHSPSQLSRCDTCGRILYVG